MVTGAAYRAVEEDALPLTSGAEEAVGCSLEENRLTAVAAREAAEGGPLVVLGSTEVAVAVRPSRDVSRDADDGRLDAVARSNSASVAALTEAHPRTVDGVCPLDSTDFARRAVARPRYRVALLLRRV